METIIIVKLDKEQIDQILVEGEIDTPATGILRLNEWAVPHWDWSERIEIGALKTNKNGSLYILGRLRAILPKNLSQDLMMLWLNYGWSIDESLEDDRIKIDFNKIHYK